MTKFQLEQQKELEEKMKAEELKEKQLAAKRAVSEDKYHSIVAVENANKQVGLLELLGLPPLGCREAAGAAAAAGEASVRSCQMAGGAGRGRRHARRPPRRRAVSPP